MQVKSAWAARGRSLSNHYIAAESAISALRWDVPSFQAETATKPPHSARHLDELEQQAYDEGFARGAAEGRAQAQHAERERLRAEGQHLQALIEHLARPLREMDAEVERMLVALALDVGGRLAMTALQDNAGAVTAVVHEAMAALMPPRRAASVHLHPADVELLQGELQLPADAGVWQLVADQTLNRGDVLVVTDSAHVDARLDTRAATLAQTLLGERA